MERRVIPNLTTFAKVAPIVWFVFGGYMLFTGHFQTNSLINAFIAISIYFFLGPAVAAFLALIPSIPYIALAYIALFLAKKNLPFISMFSMLLYFLFTTIFFIIIVVWTIYIGNWTIGAINGIF